VPAAGSPDRLDIVARAVALVASMPLSDDDRAGVLARVIDDMTKGQRRTGGYYP
jgi:gluconate kinase